MSEEGDQGSANVPEAGWMPGRNGGRLKAWPKGSEGGNPSGVSRKRLIAKELNRRLTEEPDLVRKIAETLIEASIAGDAKMMSMLLDRSDGMLEREAATVLPMIEVIVQGRGAGAPGGSGTEGTPLSGLDGGESRTESGQDPKPAPANEVREVEVLRLPAPGVRYEEEDDDDA